MRLTKEYGTWKSWTVGRLTRNSYVGISHSSVLRMPLHGRAQRGHCKHRLFHAGRLGLVAQNFRGLPEPCSPSRKQHEQLLEPHHDYYDPTKIDYMEQVVCPVAFVFWRVSQETLCKHRNPLFSVRAHVAVELLCHDEMHPVVLRRWKCEALAQDAHLHTSALRLRGELHTWYVAKRLSTRSIHELPDFSEHCGIRRGAQNSRSNDNDNDNDTLREVPHLSMRAWPYRQERRGHGPTKKNLSYR